MFIHFFLYLNLQVQLHIPLFIFFSLPPFLCRFVFPLRFVLRFSYSTFFFSQAPFICLFVTFFAFRFLMFSTLPCLFSLTQHFFCCSSFFPLFVSFFLHNQVFFSIFLQCSRQLFPFVDFFFHFLQLNLALHYAFPTYLHLACSNLISIFRFHSAISRSPSSWLSSIMTLLFPHYLPRSQKRSNIFVSYFGNYLPGQWVV